MRKFLLPALLAAALPVMADDDQIYMLDLTKATTPLEFNADNGAWSETYNSAQKVVSSQVFDFLHYGYEQYGMWWGFTPSNSADNSRKDDTMKYQFSNMATGGIVLNDDGTVKTDEFGDPVVSADVPYIVGYYASFMSERPCDILFSDGGFWEPQGVFVNLTSYPYYCMEQGDAYARSFRNGDKYNLEIVGVGADESKKSINVELCSAANGTLSICRGWKFVDLTPLGAVNEIYFNITTTDVGAYGDNTPEYFALDKLSAKKAGAGVESVKGNVNLRYERENATLYADSDEFVIVVDAAGRKVMACEGPVVSLESLPAGVYMARTAHDSIKIAR